MQEGYMSEVSYYQDGAVSVTNARAVLGGKTYAMANITSVSMAEKPANRTPGIIIAVVGLVMAACLGAAGGDSNATGLLFGVVIIGVGVAIAVLAKPSYIVKIGSASGEGDGLVSEDREQIQKIVSAMNEAIIKRG
jgi:hypothetical protein